MFNQQLRREIEALKKELNKKKEDDKEQNFNITTISATIKGMGEKLSNHIAKFDRHDDKEMAIYATIQEAIEKLEKKTITQDEKIKSLSDMMERIEKTLAQSIEDNSKTLKENAEKQDKVLKAVNDMSIKLAEKEGEKKGSDNTVQKWSLVAGIVAAVVTTGFLVISEIKELTKYNMQNHERIKTLEKKG